MVETLFYDKNGQLVESIKFYTSDAEQAGNSLIEHMFRVKIKPAKFYELAEKCPYCVMLLWTAKDNYIFIGNGILDRDGKGEPIEYNF